MQTIKKKHWGSLKKICWQFKKHRDSYELHTFLMVNVCHFSDILKMLFRNGICSSIITQPHNKLKQPSFIHYFISIFLDKNILSKNILYEYKYECDFSLQHMRTLRKLPFSKKKKNFEKTAFVGKWMRCNGLYIFLENIEGFIVIFAHYSYPPFLSSFWSWFK